MHCQFNSIWFWIKHIQKLCAYQVKHTLLIICFDHNLWSVKELITFCQQRGCIKKEEKTIVQINISVNQWHEKEMWIIEQKCFLQSLDSVFINQSLKFQVVDYVKNFLPKAEQQWYNHHGISHCISHLYYGPPGTGKSSFTLAFAEKFNLIIYKFTLSNSDFIDDYLKSLFNDMPNHCILLIKDINAYNIANKKFYVSEKKGIFSSFMKQKRLKITLSELLNALDGMASKDDRFLIMITNHLEKLDEALIQPGQIDKQIAFNLLKKQGSYNMFIQMYCEVCQFCNWT